MRSRMAEIEARLAPGRVPFAELAVLLTGASILWAVCLPPMPIYLGNIDQVADVFHPQWLILFTLLAIPLQRVAAWRYWVGLLALIIMSSLSLAITDEAIDRVHLAGLTIGGGDGLWAALAYVQVFAFMFATVRGFRQRRFVRRWARLNRKLAAADRGVKVV